MALHGVNAPNVSTEGSLITLPTRALVLRLKTYIELKVRVMSGRIIDLEEDPRTPVKEVHAHVCELLELDEDEVVWYLQHLPAHLDIATIVTNAFNIKDDVAIAGYL